MALQWQTVDVPFVGGVDQSSNPRIAAPGTFTSAVNVEFQTNGQLTKRPGLDRLTTSFANFTSRAMAYKDQVGAFVDGVRYGTRCSIKSLSGSLTETTIDTLPACTVERNTVAVSSGGTATSGFLGALAAGAASLDADTGTIWRVYAWINQGNNDCEYRIVNVATGATALKAVLGLTDAIWVRVVVSGTKCCIAVFRATANTIAMYPVTISSATAPTIGAAVLVTGVQDPTTVPGVDFDLCALTGGKFGLVYVSNAAGNNGKALRLSSALATEATVTIATQVREVAIIEDGTLTYVLYHDATNTSVPYTTITTSTWVVALGATTIWSDSPMQEGIGLASSGGSGVMAMASFDTGVSVVEPSVYWYRLGPAGTTGVGRTTYGAIGASKPFYVDGFFYQWWLMSYAPSLDLVQTFVLMELCEDQDDARPHATAAYGLGQGPNGDVYRELLSQVSVAVAGANVYRTCITVNGDGVGLPRGDEVIADFNDVNRWNAVEFGGAVYLTGGIVTMWDGYRHVSEVGYLQTPFLTVASGGAAGSLVAGATYAYVLVFERTTEAGEIVRSIVSEIKTIVIGGGDSAATLRVSPSTITLAQDGNAGSVSQQPYGQVVPYRTFANPDTSVGATYYRVWNPGENYLTTNLAARTSMYALIDGHPDTGAGGISENPELYIDGGELDSETVWGGATALAVHKNRLWTCGGEDKEIVWYSKERVDGETAAFSQALQLRFPGERCRAMASLDDALIVFTERTIWAVFGNGPDATGSTATGEFVKVLIASDTGCSQPRSIASVPAGCVFMGDGRGLMLLDRKRQLQFLGVPVQDVVDNANYFARAAVVVPRKAQVRWILGGEDLSERAVVVWDYAANKWATWEHVCSDVEDAAQDMPLDDAVYSDLAGWLPLGERDAGSGQASALFYESDSGLDDGQWFGRSLVNPRISFGSIQGYKRLRFVSLLGEKDSAGGDFGIRITVACEGYATDDVFEWSDSEINALDILQCPANVVNQQGMNYRVTIEETEPVYPAAGGTGSPWIALAFTVGTEGGINRRAGAEMR